MPSKNVLKLYYENGFYHVYNRGVEKREIFLDEQDYAVFLSYLKFYLSPPPPQKIKFDLEPKVYPSRELKNFNDQIELMCYCLMPNHFHFLIRQNERTSMTKFIRSLSTRYSMYFNRKYERVGSLFQGRYKAVSVESEQQLLYLSHYIHRNPTPTSRSVLEVENYRYSSLRNYLEKINQVWVKTDLISSYFSKSNPNLTYRAFVFDYEVEPTSGSVLE